MDKFEEATTNSGNVQQAATLKKYRVLTKCAAREAKVNGHQVILKYRSRALATTSYAHRPIATVFCSQYHEELRMHTLMHRSRNHACRI